MKTDEKNNFENIQRKKVFIAETFCYFLNSLDELEKMSPSGKDSTMMKEIASYMGSCDYFHFDDKINKWVPNFSKIRKYSIEEYHNDRISTP